MVKTLLVRVMRTYGGSASHSRSILIEPLVKIEFKGVSMALKGHGKVLLENVSGIYNPGQMHAIMGPSGSGTDANISSSIAPHVRSMAALREYCSTVQERQPSSMCSVERHTTENCQG